MAACRSLQQLHGSSKRYHTIVELAGSHFSGNFNEIPASKFGLGILIPQSGVKLSLCEQIVFQLQLYIFIHII